MNALAFRLSQMHELSKNTHGDDLERIDLLAPQVLKYAFEHKEQLLEDKFSLRMASKLQALVTAPPDVQKASELVRYLSITSTNQLPPSDP
jgi:hypothetical protein